MPLKDIKKELKKLDKEKLIELVADLYKNNKSVKDFFDFYVNPNEKELFMKYRNKVVQAFYPKRGFGYKLKDGKQAISDFKKIGPSSVLLAELMLTYVETGTKFTREYGDINESFYSSLESTFYNALSLIDKENMLDKFEDKVVEIVNKTEGIGWGFYDYIVQVFCEFYPNDSGDSE
ncbi:MAG: hypothetical protein A2041_11905 [Bacteroidetes bacterium GWA2_31_9b]|nr:MAG: hypothetical protein A2041_11905 [Bacteroidetes bacterium GWA2_31_9b]